MKPFLFAAASFVLLTPEALARDLIRVGAPVDHARLFPQSATSLAPDLLGGPGRVSSGSSSQAQIITLSPRRGSGVSGIRVFRGSSVTETGAAGAPNADPSLKGKTVIRLKKRPRNPYKTVIVYAPKSVREVRLGRNPD